MVCPPRSQLEALARGSAEPELVRELSRHLNECAACRVALEQCRDYIARPNPAPGQGAIALEGDRAVGSSARPTLSTPPDLEISYSSAAANSFPGYDIVKELHRGGQGIVYQAIQRSTRRKVAIKVVKEGPFAGRGEKMRFEREVAVLAQLRHSHIVTIHDSGEAGGCAYYVMDYIPGQSLHSWLSRARRSMRHKLLLFCKIAEAVGAAHLRGITHRDLKPGNVRVDENGEPHILDFGLAKMAGGIDASQMTQTGEFMGSLPWASPEQAEAVPGKIDIRTDVYSLGVMLYELLTGQFPYNVTGSMRDVLDRIMNAQPRRPSAVCGEVNRELETIVLKCLQKSRQRRYQNAGELAADLRRYLAGEPIRARADSLTYVVWTHARRAVRERPLTATLGALAVAMAVSQLAFVPLVYRWTPAQRYFELLLAGIAADGPVSEFKYVRVIGLTDGTDVATLARAAGLPDVSSENLRSLRRLHGALMEKLAGSGLRALAWDIAFTSPSEFDADLLRGVRAIRAQGADVVLSVNRWHLDELEPPGISPPLLRQVKWGATTGDFAGDRPWSLDLVVERPGRPAAASLALITVNAAFRPGSQIGLEIDRPSHSLLTHCWDPGCITGPVNGIGVQLTGRWPLLEDNPELGLRKEDIIGYYYITVPPDDVLQRSTLEYQDVFLAGQQQLRRWFERRIVLVGDLRSGVVRHPCDENRMVGSVYAQAAAMEAIMSSSAIRAPTASQGRVIIGLAVLAGVAASLLWHRSPLRLTLVLVLLIALAFTVAVAAYRQAGYMFNPLVPVLALLFSAMLMAFVRRQLSAGAAQVEETFA